MLGAACGLERTPMCRAELLKCNGAVPATLAGLAILMQHPASAAISEGRKVGCRWIDCN